jgi:hypothetical protein
MLLSALPGSPRAPSSARAALSCPSLVVSPSPLTITTPSDGAAYSSTVPLAIAPPNDTAAGVLASVTVCAALRGASGQAESIPVASLDATDLWSATWDTSQFASQSNVNLSFDANYLSAQSPVVLIGQRTISIDRAAPSSTLSLVGPGQYTAPDGTLFVAGATQISLAATDPSLDDGTPGSGALLYTSVDGLPAAPYVAPFDLQGLANDGPHSIAYWSVDRAGNREAPRVLSLTLDTHPPSVNPLVTGTLNGDGSYSSSVTVALPASDDGSGLRRVCYVLAPDPQPIPCSSDSQYIYVPGQELRITGTTWLGFTAQDNVGNGYDGSLAIVIATPTATPHPAGPVLVSPVPTLIRRPSVTPTHEPTPTRTPLPIAKPTAFSTPRPAPTWRPFDGPPILKRATPSDQPTIVTGQGVVHIHVMPPRRAARTPAPRCTKSRPCPTPSPRKKGH